MKHHFFSISLLCLLALLSCSNREQEDIVIEHIIEQDTVIVDKKDTVIVNEKDTIIIDKKDTIIIERDSNTKKEYIILNKDETINFNIKQVTYWMRQPRATRGKQGGDVYNGFFCQFEGGHSVLDIIDIKNKQNIATIELDYNDNYHCNNADFSNTFYDINDEFPLLYSSQQDRYARCIIVDRLVKRNDNYTLETIQRIDLPFEQEEPLQHYPDAVIDNMNGFLYVYAGRSSDFYIYKFRLPKIEEGEVVKLTEEDVLARWVFGDNPARYRQGGKIIGNFLIILEGKSDNKMRIIDLDNHRYKLINLTSDFGAKWEPEDIFEIDGEIFVASGGTGIYKIELSN